jgi:hypothetical protein
MPHFERRFVRPSRFQVVDALMQAAQGVRAGPAGAEDERERWDNFVNELRDQPEGFQQWEGDGIVALAWWTDHLRRRHFRIWAGSADDIGHYCLRHDKNDPRPAVWHLAPDQVFYRERAGEPLWLAVCACGMTGTPEAIGWMGDRCGCCHYKPAEAPAEAPVRFANFRDAKHALKQLAFSPDGRWLAGAGPGNAVHLWDVAEGRYHGLVLSRAGASLALTFTPDSRLLAIARSDRLLHFVGIPTGEEVAAYPTPSDVLFVTIAPDNLTLAVGANHSLEIWGRPESGLPWLPIYERQVNVYSAAFNARGNRLAVGLSAAVKVFGIIEHAGYPHLCQKRSMSWTPRAITFSGDGKRVAFVQQETPHQVVYWQIDDNLDSSTHLLHRPSDIYAISPDTKWLAGIKANSIEIENVRDEDRWFLLLGQRPFTALAFSPDGHTLATADRDGSVKLWPWRRLIEV